MRWLLTKMSMCVSLLCLRVSAHFIFHSITPFRCGDKGGWRQESRLLKHMGHVIYHVCGWRNESPSVAWHWSLYGPAIVSSSTWWSSVCSNGGEETSTEEGISLEREVLTSSRLLFLSSIKFEGKLKFAFQYSLSEVVFQIHFTDFSFVKVWILRPGLATLMLH